MIYLLTLAVIVLAWFVFWLDFVFRKTIKDETVITGVDVLMLLLEQALIAILSGKSFGGHNCIKIT